MDIASFFIHKICHLKRGKKIKIVYFQLPCSGGKIPHFQFDEKKETCVSKLLMKFTHRMWFGGGKYSLYGNIFTNKEEVLRKIWRIVFTRAGGMKSYMPLSSRHQKERTFQTQCMCPSLHQPKLFQNAVLVVPIVIKISRIGLQKKLMTRANMSKLNIRK